MQSETFEVWNVCVGPREPEPLCGTFVQPGTFVEPPNLGEPEPLSGTFVEPGTF